MPPKKTLILVIAVAAIAALGAWFGASVFGPGGSDPAGPSKYSAVYLATGDIYFGELHWFPQPHLTNVWFLQKSVGADNKISFGVNQFKDAFWAPADEVNINPKQIVLWTRLRNESQVVRILQSGVNESKSATSGK